MKESRKQRFERRAALMKEKYKERISPNDRHEAMRRGYNDAVEGMVGSRDLAPFSSPELRKSWRTGFDMGKKGIQVKLPPGSVMPTQKVS